MQRERPKLTIIPISTPTPQRRADRSLNLARYLPHELIPSRQGDDGEQGPEEGGCAGYAPGGEDDAEVFGGPGEEHLLVLVS